MTAEKTTLIDHVNKNCEQFPQRVWLRDRRGDNFTEWNWSDARTEINAAAAWLEQRYGASQENIVLLSRNRAHWFMADLAIIGSGNVTVPIFTTLAPSVAEYIFDFTGTHVLILGEADNWAAVREVLPESIEIITLPGVEIDMPNTRWEDLIAKSAGLKPSHKPVPDDLVSLVFTSGTTGVPKGVMQTHDSMLLPMQRSVKMMGLDGHECPRFLSYLPLSHIAERQLVMIKSMLTAGSVTFNESLPNLLRDMAETRPSFFFGAPRVWEQLQQGILAQFGSQQALETALASDHEGVGLKVRTLLGLNDAIFLLTAAAPTPPALIKWYAELGLQVMEGFGQTEIMVTAVCTNDRCRIGSVGPVVDGVEVKISDQGELLFKAEGAATGYYKMPEKTAETFVDGWVHTGDKGYIDDDGFIFLTGRVKDYFKTIQGKFVAPTPVENLFAKSQWTEQICLLGRGYSKTVMVCVLSEAAMNADQADIERSLIKQAIEVNEKVEHHARIGAVIISPQSWTIENMMLTPTLKIRRDEVESRFGERAFELALDGAVQGTIQLEWLHPGTS